jgi:hypothetical protein
MILASHGIIASQIQSFVGLLDLYPSASAAYSLRKLRAGYTGSAIRVRRSSDNAEQDIGFDATGNLDTSALTTFCGANNGFVTTWYDQSGNSNNVLQATAIQQPKIVGSGIVNLDNGKPTIKFAGANSMFSSSINFKYCFAVINPAINNYASYVNYVSKFIFLRVATTNELYNSNMLFPNFATVTYVNNTQTLLFSNSALQIFSSGGSTTNASNQNLELAYNPNAGTYGPMNCTEVICFTDDKTSSRSGINTNINSYYAIY